MGDLPKYTVRGKTEIQNGFLRTIRMGLIARGVANPNVSPKSDWAVEAEAISEQLIVVEANAVVKANDALEDTSTGVALLRLAALRGVVTRPAAGSRGPAIMSSSAAATAATGARLLDEAGLRYKVVTGGTFANGETFAVEAEDTGLETNLEAGAVLRWVASPPYADEKVLVGTGGLRNGAAADDEESIRRRLLPVLRDPPASGNSSHTAIVAENTTSSVQKCFVYPAIQGGATCHAAVVSSPTATNKSRVVDPAIVSGTVRPAIVAIIEHTEYTVTSVTDLQADVSVGLSLPDSPAASPPGPGGGWSQGSPWPSLVATNSATDADWRCAVTAVISSQRFTVDAATAPTAGVHEICWLSPTDWKLYTALVTVVHATTPGAVEVSIDTAFPNIAIGCWIWPKCEQASDLVATALAHFQLMGPGEKTANTSALTRGSRKPAPETTYPFALDATYIDSLRSVATAIRSGQFFFRTYVGLGTPVRGSTSGRLAPPAPALVTDPPNIFIPRHIGFYRVPQ